MTTPATHGPYRTEAQARADVDALHARAAAQGESDTRRAQERDVYAAEARALRVQLAAALAIQAEQANTIGDLRALLDAAHITYRDRVAERCALAPALIGA